MYLDREKLLAHINDSEKITLLRRMIDLMEIALKNHQVQYSDFLDPYELKLTQEIANSIFDLKTDVSEVGPENERCIIAFGPEYMGFSANDELALLKIESSMSILTHRSILGSLLGLGIARDRVGDISVHGEFAHVLVKREIADYLLVFLKKVGRNNVQVKELSLSKYEPSRENFSIHESVISSNRLDAFVASIYRMSRQKAKTLIESERVKVNFKTETKANTEVEEGALISVRGFGRSIFESSHGRTRKDRLKITYKLLNEE